MLQNILPRATYTQMAMDVITVFTNLLKSMDEELKAKIVLITPLQPNITKVFCVLLSYFSFRLLHLSSLVYHKSTRDT